VSYPPPPPPGGQPPYQQPPYAYGYYPPQAYYQPPPRIDPKQLKPSRTWYWLGAIPAVVGTIVAIVFAVQFVDRLDPHIDNFRSNHTAVVHLNSGDRAIYVQTRRRGTPLRVPAGDLRCNVSFIRTIGGDPQPVAVHHTSGSTLDLNDDSYAAEYKFHAPHDGPYRVICEGPEGMRLAIGPHLSFGLFAPLVAAIGAFLLGGLLTVVMEVVTGVRRSNHKQRLQREAREAQARQG
jgi:hypothetical protein